MEMKELLEECRGILERHYGPRMKGLVLYGSMARGDADEESDIDLLVLLEPPFRYVQELFEIIDLLYPLQLKADHLISAHPASAQDFGVGAIELYRNAKREGVLV